MNEEEIEGGIIKSVNATSVLALLAGISAGWITFVNTLNMSASTSRPYNSANARSASRSPASASPQKPGTLG